MKIRTVAALALIVALAAFGGFTRVHAVASKVKNAPATLMGKGEAQPGDDRGGHGHGKDDVAKGEAQPGDDRGGHGRGADDAKA